MIFSVFGKLFGKECWVGVVDVVGSYVFVNVCVIMCYCGVVMVCGFVVGMDFFVIVVLFILCGVMFVGIDSVMCLCVEWLEVWCWFVFDFDVEKLGVIGY